MFYRIEYPAYADRPANTIHVVGQKSRDLHVGQVKNAGATDIKITELTAAEYRAAVFAKVGR